MKINRKLGLTFLAKISSVFIAMIHFLRQDFDGFFCYYPNQ